MPIKIFSKKKSYHESALKEKYIVSTEKNGTLVAESKFDFSEGRICYWRNNYNFVFSCKATRIYFMRPKEVRHPEI